MRKLVILVLIGLMVIGTGSFAQDDVNAATVIADFDTESESDFTPTWWTYDDGGSDFVLAVDHDVFYDGDASLRLDLNVQSGGYAGAGFDYGVPYDWRAGEGIILQIRATEVGIPVIFVLHVKDETQTSAQTPGTTPFAYYFDTPEGSTEDWVAVTLPWDGFERLWWVGEEGITEFTSDGVTKVEIGFDAEDDRVIEGSIWLDDIRVISEENLNVPPSFEELVGDIIPIRVNQIGYTPDARKRFVSNQAFLEFSIVDDATGEEVYTGRSLRFGYDDDSEEEVYWGIFHDFDMPGTYRIVIEDVGESYPFAISENIYDEAMILGTRALYLQRSGIAVSDETSGIQLEAGHLENAVLWDDNSVALDVSGGWYDAGDFGRYIPTAAFAVNQLMIGYNANPDYFTDGFLNIPESGNGVNDLLDEIRWELEWMLKMQREDGAVYHKVTSRSFPGFGTLPAEDTEQFYVFGVSSADTAYFAAALAQASYTYADVDPEFAAKCLAAAERAWAWLQDHPEQFPAGGFQNPPVSDYPMQGGYDFVGVEFVPRMWAASELFKATGNITYQNAFATLFPEAEASQAMSWANSYPMALYAYLTSPNADPELWEAVADVFERQARNIFNVTRRSGYGVALNDGIAGFEYVWGSNQVALAHGLYLMMANELFPNDNYANAALAQVHYLFGVNPLGKSYFGGLGANPILQPHHNVSFHFKISVPGFVSEGANSQGAGGDATLLALWDAEVPSAMRFTDDWNSWASNEPTIDANATFVALLSYFVD